jgi:hypothetical protein
MSDLTATSERLADDRTGGWTAILAPDERLPEGSWAVSPGCFARTWTHRGSDADLQYSQTIWTANAFAKKGWLTFGPAEDGLWPIDFPDGSTDFAFVVNQIYSLHDLGKVSGELRYDDRYNARTFPRAEGVRLGPRAGHDEFGRQRISRASCDE